MLDRYESRDSQRPRKAPASSGRVTVVFVVVCSAVAIALEFLLFSSLGSSFAQAYEGEHRNSLVRMMTIARSTIEPTLRALKDGTISKETALEEVRASVRRMMYVDRYGPNYVFMSTYDGIMLVQPYDVAKEGSNQWDLQDEKGTHIIRALTAAALDRPEGSFVEYWFYPPGKDHQEQKTSYVIGLPELGAYIGTGMYSQALSEAIDRFLVRTTVGSIFLMALTAALAVLSTRTILATNRRLVNDLERLSAAEEALEISERNLRVLFDTIDDAVFVHDEEGRILEANEGAVRMYGVPVDVLKTLTAVDITGGEDAETRVAEVLAEYRERGSLRIDLQAQRRSDGICFDVEIYLTRGEWFGKPAIIAVVRDVTERRRTERSLRERTAELERFERLVVGRELKMIELKRRIAELPSETPDA